METARQWHQGVLYPHWDGSANFGAGEPRFVFYPPLSWMLGAILGSFLPWTWTPLAFTLVCLLAIGGACYKMAREWMPPDSAILTACLYIISPYIFFVIYERGACGELLAAAWLPLLILYALRKKPAAPQLALTVAALWLTDAPVGVMGSYTLALIALVAAISECRWMPILRAIIGIALGLGLAAVYIIPADYEERWVQIKRAIMPGMSIQDSFLFEHTGMQYHDQVLHTASWIAVVLLIATAIAAALSYLDGKPNPLRKPLLALAILITFLLFPISNFIWTSAPELRYLQFPWRWLLVLSLVFATLGAPVLDYLVSAALYAKHKMLVPASRAAIVLIVAAIFSFHAAKHFWTACDEEDNVRAQIATLHQQGFEGTEEYTPVGADNGDIQRNLAPVRVLYAPNGDENYSSLQINPDWQPSQKDLVPTIIQIARWQTEHMTAEIQSPQPGYAVLRLMDYPTWRVRINNIPVQLRERRDDGLLTIPIPAGTSTIDVRYAITPDVWAGRSISLISLVIWLVLWFALALQSRRPQTPTP